MTNFVPPFTMMNIAYRNERTRYGLRPMVYIFSRDQERERHVLKLTNRSPDFYGACKKGDRGSEPDMLWRPVKKIVFEGEIPSIVADERERYRYHCQAKILFERKVWLDLKTKCMFNLDADKKVIPVDESKHKYIPPRIAYIDSEWRMFRDDPIDTWNPTDPMVCFQILDSYTLEGYLIYWTGEDPVEMESFFVDVEWEHEKKQYTHRFPFWIIEVSNERELYDEMGTIVDMISPDVFTTWNGGGEPHSKQTRPFDWPMIIRRGMRRHFWKGMKMLSPLRDVKVSDEGHPRIKGVSCLDMMNLYTRKSSATGREKSYGLKAVVKRRTGWEYEPYGGEIPELRDNESLKLLEYSANDVVALWLVDQTTA